MIVSVYIIFTFTISSFEDIFYSADYLHSSSSMDSEKEIKFYSSDFQCYEQSRQFVALSG